MSDDKEQQSFQSHIEWLRNVFMTQRMLTTGKEFDQIVNLQEQIDLLLDKHYNGEDNG